MGVDISMTAGVGIHLKQEHLDRWLKVFDPYAEMGVWEALENLVYSDKYRGLTFDSPNNSWTDREPYPRGMVIFVSRVSTSYDMRREAEAGVFRPGKNSITLAERELLNQISLEIAGEELLIEPIISVGIH